MLLDRVLSERFNVKAFTSGLEALTWLTDGSKVDLILTDLVMTDITGLDIVQNIRSSGIFKDLPVVILSGNIDPSKQEECLTAGASLYMTKPFRPDILIESIERILEGSISDSETRKLNSYVN
jgi:two-component system chemotaxis response regulator CheY